jgi:hypothetical protein
MHTSPLPSVLFLAAIYHEACRAAVTAGSTLAHAVGQAKPFTELADLRVEALQGRLLTATELLGRFDFTGFAPAGLPDAAKVEQLAAAIHECERPAIDRGWTVVQLDPPRPWIPFADLPELAREGRRWQARYLLRMFVVSPRAGERLKTTIKAPFEVAAGVVSFYAGDPMRTMGFQVLGVDKVGTRFVLWEDGGAVARQSSLAEVAAMFPGVAPTVNDWKHKRWQPFWAMAEVAYRDAGYEPPTS